MRMHFDVWKWLVAKDDLLLSAIECIWSAKGLYGLRNLKWRCVGATLLKKHRAKTEGRDVVIVLNGPSVKEQPLARLKGKDLIFVNQGFRLQIYKELQPKYHVFIDSKMIHGVWDIKWLDEIYNMNPNVTFVMPASWARLPLLKHCTGRK